MSDERDARDIFDVIEEMDKRMRRIMERAFSSLSMDIDEQLYDMERRELKPLTQISETDDEVIVTLDIPCASKESIEVKATEDTLFIRARMDRCVTFSNVEFENYSKSVRLPARVEPKSARASFRNGVLQVRLPKKFEGSEISVE
ncbi:MAG: Hsp20/alpha crystallin family protein [Candidatus Nitrosocaldus sp.]|nr:Hsp20/alpha crystallin family protein [Candidatus Nitrosocaldus sp.]MDW8275721.1 Hsp20/alpha crystallin family protein [Candidatus Nitrosocaldus sp.]